MRALKSESNHEVIAKVCALVEERTGVQLGAKQYEMASSRLRRRMGDLGLASLEEYWEYFEANRIGETEALVSLLTTHHTYFFREFAQFELLQALLPGLMSRAKEEKRPLEVWSAACSRGQEVYSLAMHLNYHLKGSDAEQGYRIFGTDVDPESVKIASNGVYLRDEIKEVPMTYLGDHWARGTGAIEKFVKAKKTLRANCDFAVANLMSVGDLGGRKFDVIFCRNVFIYFTPDQVKEVTRALLARLRPGGILAIGLSESLHGMNLPLENIGPSVYGTKPEGKAQAAAPVPAKVVPISSARKLRVVCVDDSPTVLAILKKVLTQEQGFEVVGTAANGDIAATVIGQLKPDLVTLDIHMPVCDGVEYLRKYRKADHPPVLMVTSVSRDDASLAHTALGLGAVDYVEKPAMNNLEKSGEELRAKLKTAFASRRTSGISSVDREFSTTTTGSSGSGKGRIVWLTEADLPRAESTLKELAKSKLPFWVVSKDSAKSFADRVASLTGVKGIRVFQEKDLAAELTKSKWKKLSVICFGNPPGSVTNWKAAKLQVLVEDGISPPRVANAVTDVTPATSFLYTSERFFGEDE